MIEGFPLSKMPARIDGVVQYAIRSPDGPIDLAPYIGKQFAVHATGALSCCSCGKRVKKFYGQGFCFPCLQNAPEAAECIIRPELCRAHLGEGRDPEWEKEHHVTEHIVYLSRTSGIKVGITRSTQVPTRWIDQGAVAAIAIARVPYRQLAGEIEVNLKAAFADRTNWRAMLKKVDPDSQGLKHIRDKGFASLPAELHQYLLPQEQPVIIEYPLLAYPPKIASVQLARTPEVSGRLMGIKGQYLIWEDGRVLNIRNHTGYHVNVG